MSEGLVKYLCPVCGEENYADANDALVTCNKGHHLTLGSLPDDNGFVGAEQIPETDEEE